VTDRERNLMEGLSGVRMVHLRPVGADWSVPGAVTVTDSGPDVRYVVGRHLRPLPGANLAQGRDVPRPSNHLRLRVCGPATRGCVMRCPSAAS